MPDIEYTSAHISLPDPTRTETSNYVAGEDIQAGQAVYLSAVGRAMLAYVDTSEVERPALQFRGIALNSAAAGQAVTVVHCGRVAGFDVSELDVGTILYLSEETGRITDEESSHAVVPVGVVDAVITGYTLPNKVVRVLTAWTVEWDFT